MVIGASTYVQKVDSNSNLVCLSGRNNMRRYLEIEFVMHTPYEGTLTRLPPKIRFKPNTDFAQRLYFANCDLPVIT